MDRNHQRVPINISLVLAAAQESPKFQGFVRIEQGMPKIVLTFVCLYSIINYWRIKKDVKTMEQYVENICEILHIESEKENRGYSVPIIILALLSVKTAKEAAVLIGCPDRTLSRILDEEFPSLKSKEKWRTKLLALLGKNICYNCEVVNEVSEMVSRHANLCKKCDCEKSKQYRTVHKEACLDRSRNHYYANKSSYLARNALRRAKKLNATPSWADHEKIKEIYNNCPEGYHVDHIVPLQGELVSGLHVECNLQYLTAEENLKKHNKFIAG